jgi:hypothetical protein
MSHRHNFIKTGDKDVFAQIQDRNGEVVLQYCRVCKGAEGDLKLSCPGPRFEFEVEGRIFLHRDAIWPDNDAPENPTVEDVAAVIKKAGGAQKILKDWDLEPELFLTVSDDKDSKIIP